MESPSSEDEPTTADLLFMINHLFMPPKLPQEDDSSAQKNQILRVTVLRSLENFLRRYRDDSGDAPLLRVSISIVDQMISSSPEGTLLADVVEAQMGAMKDKDVLAFHIRAQNAAVLIRRRNTTYTFETFEVSCPNAEVTSTKGRLERVFPQEAISINANVMDDVTFREPFSEMLAAMDKTTPAHARPTTRKAERDLPEIRDTVNPTYINQLAFGILRGVGTSQDVSRIRKRTQDEVLWSNTLNPWRRSPLWTVLRVAFQTTFMQQSVSADHGQTLFKAFMIHIMSQLLVQAVEHNLHSDLIHTMQRKLIRRLQKLASGSGQYFIDENTRWTDQVKSILSLSADELHKRWKKIEMPNDPFRTQHEWNVNEFSFPNDTALQLASLRKNFDGLFNRNKPISCNPAVEVDYSTRILPNNTALPAANTLLSSWELVGDDARRILLCDLEVWVRYSLADWSRSNIDRMSSCSEIADLIHTYTHAAIETYKEDQESLSRMILTAMELWVVLDKFACHQEPILLDYSTEFPAGVLDPLLLPLKSQMARLLGIESYLHKRDCASKKSYPSVFGSFGKQHSLPVCYFDSSGKHQLLRRTIEQEARSARDQKKEELRNLKAQYANYRSRADALSHDHVIILSDGRRGRREEHSSICQKCALNETAAAMRIERHEWHLPSDHSQAKAVVFELDCPTPISTWRDTTYYLLVDVFTPASLKRNGGNPSADYTLSEYDSLRAHFRSQPGARIGLASGAKPTVRSHYRFEMASSATENNVCVKHAMRYEVYDLGNTHRIAEELIGLSDIRDQCSQPLPDGKFKMLQFAVDNTTHQSNQIVAGQSSCPFNLTIHEYMAFGHLRSGHLLQWQNIARLLVDDSMSLNQPEAIIILSQTAWQAGPSSPEENRLLRDSHCMLGDAPYCMDVLSSLDAIISNINENWRGMMSVQVVVVLICRILSMTPHVQVRERCFDLLTAARCGTLAWTQKLKRELLSCVTDEQRTSLMQIALEAALSCHSTFVVDLPDFEHIIKREDAVAILIEIAITVDELRPSRTTHLSLHIQRLLRRFTTSAQIFEKSLCSAILANRAGVDRSIAQLWKSYRPGAPWKPASESSCEWIMTATSETNRSASVPIHLNLLTGCLLVDGSPLSRLPHQYEAHATYQRHFSKMYISVIPSTIPGMRYESRSPIFGYQIHFLMQGSDLIVEATRDDQSFRIVPTSALSGDFPPSFVDNHSHWLDLHTKQLEFRSLSDPWMSQKSSWKIANLGSGINTMKREAVMHIDMHSPTASAIHKVLGPIEHRDHIHVSLAPETSTLDIHLPRLQLDFFVNHAGQIESRQRRGMVVDDIQTCGTFTGLRTKLVLRSIKDMSQCLIIPYGTIRSHMEGNHVEVRIETGSGKEVPHSYYELDSTIWQLKDNNTMRSCLFRTLLHAHTSHCLPDAFTGKTGTEQAITNLREARIQSFRTLQNDDIQLLQKIAGLTPRRTYYPQHLKAMQQVEWDGQLPPLSQHESFSALVFDIFGRAKEQKLFYPTGDLPLENRFGEPDLLSRAVLRNSIFRGLENGAGAYTTDHDVEHTERSKLKEEKICRLSTQVHQWCTDLSPSRNLLRDMEGWGDSIEGKNNFGYDWLRYDMSWVSTPEVMSNCFCQLLHLIKSADPKTHRYRIMIVLSTLAHSSQDTNMILETLLSFGTVPQLRALPLPRHQRYNLGDGYMPKKTALMELIDSSAKEFRVCPESLLPQQLFESDWQLEVRRREAHEATRDAKAHELADKLILQWPAFTNTLNLQGSFSSHFDMDRVRESANDLFSSWSRNKDFKKSIDMAQVIMNNLQPSRLRSSAYLIAQPASSLPKQNHTVSWDIMLSRPPPQLDVSDGFDHSSFLVQSPTEQSHERTKALIECARSRNTKAYENLYTDDMLRSLNHLHTIQQDYHLSPGKETKLRNILERRLSLIERKIKLAFDAIRRETMNPDSMMDGLLHSLDMWPRLTPTTLLDQLVRVRTAQHGWTKVFLEYGVLLTKLQYYKRLLALPIESVEFLKEFKNPGHIGWDPADYPEWLIFEIENNLFIRPEQAQVAKEMLDPGSNANTAMQLNMGEGKSSVIAPIVLATLARGASLPRMIVLPSLFAQMFHLLRQKLGGILGHRVVGLPFSRSTAVSKADAGAIQHMYQALRQQGCVVLCQPEHILSFDLMGVEKSIKSAQSQGDDSQSATTLVNTQRWIENNTRDILDESDEILNVRFELVYTMGMQTAIDFAPRRWEIVYNVLHKLKQHLQDAPSWLHGGLSEGFSVQDRRREAFPRFQILEPGPGEELLKRIVRDIFTGGGVQGLPILSLSPEDSQSLIDYVLTPNLPEPTDTPVLKSFFELKDVRMILYLLKGLFGHGLLLFAFQHKRWRVNYGHDFSRSMLAVPFRAKDLPAPRAEFSHPDVTILLTCLSYYYEGLTDAQMFQCFEEVLGTDDPDGEYRSWVSEVQDIPAAFSTLLGVNVKDSLQCTEQLFPIIRRSQALIDFFMSHLVFPKEMKEFPNKLSSSSWDIAQVKRHPTTGFSGTNDSRYLLPLSMRQFDIPEQVHTNATVLDCLLQPRNTYQMIPGAGDAEALLKLVVSAQPEVRVILDVGALVLDWRNHVVAMKWLQHVPAGQADGVVYFDDQDELMVLMRDGRSQSLQESSLQKQMDRCLIYLDEAHTRGTNLELPSDYRAAATLGIGISKDRLVQACMRMRKLAQTQSVLLSAPAEIERKIRQHVEKPLPMSLGVEDVLLWSISNTHQYTKKCVPLWAIQGMRYQRRKVVWNDSGDAEDLLEPEAKSLKEWYSARQRTGASDWMQRYGSEVVMERRSEVEEIQKTMRDFDASTVNDATLYEEQERELSPESELERQLERPPFREPATHTLHPDLVRMVNDGTLNLDSKALVPAFCTLGETKLASRFSLVTWPSGLWVTRDFSRTVQAQLDDKQDEFLRPPRWILRCHNSGTCIIVSPFEAQNLFSQIRKVGKIGLHIYAPRIRDSMRAIDDLSYCAVPGQQRLLAPWPHFEQEKAAQAQLNLFAGQLFFSSEEQYQTACRFLGLAFRGSHKGTRMSADGFIDPKDRAGYDQRMADQCRMVVSPVYLLRGLLEARRKGQGFKKSHMGLLLSGELPQLAVRLG